MREFNTEGPVVSADHYCIPPLQRIDLDEVLGLVRRKKYFVLHAPRQTGKTYGQVQQPSYVWLNYAVCGCEADSCGWQGWIVESAFLRREGGEEMFLPSDSQLNCPECRKPLFRTEVSYRFEPSEDQTTRMIPGVDYQETPMGYYGEAGLDIAVTPPMRRAQGAWREIERPRS